MQYNKIIVIGSPGSGKSYLAKKLSEITSYPLYHLDNLFWNPGWIETPKEKWIEVQKKITTGDKWIIDGNYDSTMDIRFEACDAIIFININRVICIKNAIIRHGKKRTDLPDYCVEKFNKDLLEFLIYIWRFPKNKKPNIIALHERYKDKPFIELRNKNDINNLLKKGVKNERQEYKNKY